MSMTVIPTVIVVFGTVSKGLEKWREEMEIRGRIKIIVTAALLSSARILRRVLETREDLLSRRLQLKTPVKADVKNSMCEIIIIIKTIKNCNKSNTRTEKRNNKTEKQKMDWKNYPSPQKITRTLQPYQVLPLRVDLGAMAMKGYSASPKAPALLEPHHQII